MDISLFGSNKSRADGLNLWCKACVRESNKKPERLKYKVLWARKKYQTEEGKRKMKEYAASERALALQEKRRKQEIAKDPSRVIANHAVGYAVRRGYIPHPKTLLCVHCDEPATQYHHPLGYSPEHKLHVEPICQSCHDCFRSKYPPPS